MPKILSVKTLTINSYRNFSELNLDFNPTPVVITGDNGVGKTNLLEAISLLAPGRGLRSAKFSDIGQNSSEQSWHLRALVNGSYNHSEISMNYDTSTSTRDKRTIIVNGEKIKSNAELSKVFAVIWLTPQMDGLFIASSSDRRKFFDRLVYNFDSEHASRVAKYEYFMRERNSILKHHSYDPIWLEILERKMSEAAIAIIMSRLEAEGYLQQAIFDSTSNFPKAHIKIEGELEKIARTMPSLELEKYYANILKQNRKIDGIKGRTSVGPHRSELVVTHIEKNQQACLCSTGEQKSLLISLILADVRAKIKWNKITPVLLLDEVIAHLDEHKQEELFSELLSMKCQFWITGVDQNSFTKLKNKAQFVEM